MAQKIAPLLSSTLSSSNMKKEIIQISKHQWRAGEPLEAALISYLPTDIEKKLGIQFHDSQDNLDYTKEAYIEDADGNQYILVHHLNAPQSGQGTLLIIHQNINASQILKNGLALLGIGPENLKWVHPDIMLNTKEI